MNAGGREPFGELLVERMQTAHVRRDHDAAIALACLREMRAKLRRVLACDDDVLAARAAGDEAKIRRHIWRMGAGWMTHGASMLPSMDPVCSRGWPT